MVPILPEPFPEKKDSTRQDSVPAAGTLNENNPLVTFHEVSLGLQGGRVFFFPGTPSLHSLSGEAPAMLTQVWGAGWLPSFLHAKKVLQLQTTEMRKKLRSKER